MLTYRPAAKASWASRQLSVAILLFFVGLIPAFADGVDNLNCVGGFQAFNCVEQWGRAVDPYVRIVPDGLRETEKAQASDRDHQWLARCRPRREHDVYGVLRYRYAEPGCEFGAPGE